MAGRDAREAVEKMVVNRCMDGRYGLDGLSALCICAALLGCGRNIPSQGIRFGTFLWAAVLGSYGLCRCFSRDVQKHQWQWDSIERELDEIDYRISLYTGVWKIRHSYRYVRCKTAVTGFGFQGSVKSRKLPARTVNTAMETSAKSWAAALETTDT